MPQSCRVQSLRVLPTAGSAPALDGCSESMPDVGESRQRTIPRNRDALVLEKFSGRGERI